MNINQNKIPNNVELSQIKIEAKCHEIERYFPEWFNGYSISIMHLTPNSRLNYLSDINQFFNYLIECKIIDNLEDISDITALHLNTIDSSHINDFLRKYIQFRTIRGKNGNNVVRKLSESSLSRKKSSITSLFTYLYKNNLVDKDITSKFIQIRPPAKNSDSIVRLHGEEISNLMTILEMGQDLTAKEKDYWEKCKKRDTLIISMLLLYGLRVSELQQINISSISFRHHEYKIVRKGQFISALPLNEDIEEMIRDYIETERKSLKYYEGNEDSKDALFLSLQGKRISINAISNLVKKYTRKSIGLGSGYSPHKLRATCASSLIEQGYNIYDVKALLDHSHVISTERYASENKDAKEFLTKKKFWDKK